MTVARFRLSRRRHFPQIGWMVPSWVAEHGDPQSFGLQREGKGSWCGRRDLNPHGPCGPTDFHTFYGFRRRPTLSQWGLVSGLSLHHVRRGFRCCPSSLYTFPASFSRAWLGIAMLQGSPTLSSSAPPVSRRALKFFRLSPMRLPIPPRPHGSKGSTKQRLTRSDF